jgi:hypothetical protein
MRARKLKRKQPRRLTPPLFLRGDSGERVAVEVDQEHVTSERFTSTRTSALLVLSPGLRVEVGSRCINKRRVPVLRISPRDYTPAEPQIGDAFNRARGL